MWAKILKIPDFDKTLFEVKQISDSVRLQRNRSSKDWLSLDWKKVDISPPWEEISTNRWNIARILWRENKWVSFILLNDEWKIAFASPEFLRMFWVTWVSWYPFLLPNVALPWWIDWSSRSPNQLNPGEAYHGTTKIYSWDKRRKQTDIIIWKVSWMINWVVNPSIIEFSPSEPLLIKDKIGKIKINERITQDERLKLFRELIHNIKNILVSMSSFLIINSNIKDKEVQKALRIINHFLGASKSFLENVSNGKKTWANDWWNLFFHSDIVSVLNQMASSTILIWWRILSLTDNKISNLDKQVLQWRVNEILWLVEFFWKIPSSNIFKLKDSLRSIAKFHKKSWIEINLDIDWLWSGLKYVEWSELDLKQILDNLISNAIKFSPPNGIITIKAELDWNNYLSFSVIDQWNWISDDRKLLIFNEFNTSWEDQWTWIWLSSVAGLVKKHKGIISVEDNKSWKWTSFKFSFPLACVNWYIWKYEMRKMLKVSDGILPKIESNQDLRVLVVEDAPDTRALIWMFLRWYTVDFASNSNEAIAKLNNWRYHCAIIDNQFWGDENPKSAGWAVLSGVIKWKRPEMKILAFSADEKWSESYAEYKRSGVDWFIDKGLLRRDVVLEQVNRACEGFLNK